jgi:hypothetical protein
MRLSHIPQGKQKKLPVSLLNRRVEISGSFAGILQSLDEIFLIGCAF